MVHMMKTLFVLGSVLALASPALAARKDSKDKAADKEAKERTATREAKERAAKKACLNGEATKGVELLTDLYVDSNDPTYIYNQGRCYEQNDRCEDAIVRFREYLRKTVGGNENDRADVQRHIVDCESLLAKRAADSPAATAGLAPPPAPVPVPGPAAPASTVAAAPVAVTVAKPHGDSSAGSGLRMAGVATMIAGGAALVAGLVFNLKHNGMIKDLKGDYSGATADSADSYKTLSMVGYGVGAACVVGGAALYWLGWRAGRTVVGPTVVSGNAGLQLTGAF